MLVNVYIIYIIWFLKKTKYFIDVIIRSDFNIIKIYTNINFCGHSILTYCNLFEYVWHILLFINIRFGKVQCTDMNIIIFYRYIYIYNTKLLLSRCGNAFSSNTHTDTLITSLPYKIRSLVHTNGILLTRRVAGVHGY